MPILVGGFFFFSPLGIIRNEKVNLCNYYIGIESQLPANFKKKNKTQQHAQLSFIVSTTYCLTVGILCS